MIAERTLFTYGSCVAVRWSSFVGEKKKLIGKCLRRKVHLPWRAVFISFRHFRNDTNGRESVIALT